MERKQLTDMVISSLEEVLEEKGEQEKYSREELTEETALIGKRAFIDSMGLVSLIINLESKLAGEGAVVTLADERAMSQSKSPFRTVGSLAGYISLLLDELNKG